MFGTFLQTPRRTALRRWIFNVHFYAGLIAGVLWLAVGVTGSVLVFIPELRRIEVPGWSRVKPIGQALPLETLWQRLHRERPTDKMVSVYFDFKPTWGLNFRTVSSSGDRIHNFVDQYQGTILASVNYTTYSHSPLQWFYDLHADLLGGAVGRKVNAWLAFALCGMALTGLLLWWRGHRHWRLGLEYRWKASWKRQTWDLHNFGGFLFFLPLLLVSLSGAYFAYSQMFVSAAGFLTRGPGEIPPPKALQEGARRSLDELVASALRALPDSEPSMIIWPSKPGEPFTLRMRRPGDLHRIGLNWVYVDPASAKVLRVDRFDQQPLGVQLVRLMIPMHYGTIGGITTRLLWLVVGLAPGVLFVAALLMWWNRSLSKKRRKRSFASTRVPLAIPQIKSGQTKSFSNTPNRGSSKGGSLEYHE